MMPIKVFVGNLPENCSKDTLRDVFGSYGGIDDVAVVKNYAFVHFSDEHDASCAVRDLDGSKIGGKQINVEISKKQGDNRGRRENRDRDRDRGYRRGRGGPDKSVGIGGILGAGPPPPGLGGLGGLGSAPLGGLGSVPPLGGLGAPNANAPPLGGLGILSAVNTLAAVAEKQQQLSSEQKHQPLPERRHERDQPDPDVRVRREVVHTRDVPNAGSMGLSNGYVIHERYYVDPAHPLLKGLPLPELPRMSDNITPRGTYRNESFSRRDDYDSYRERSPVNNGRREPDRRVDYQNDFRR